MTAEEREAKKKELLGDTAPQYFASISGGKDSAAMSLFLKEQGIEHRRVFFDTGWEHPDLYSYLKDELPEAIGEIEFLTPPLPNLDEEQEALAVYFEELLGHSPSGMLRWIIYKGMFPSRIHRWCTQNLKMKTIKAFMKSNDFERPVNVVGIRADESEARSKLPEREISTSMDCMVWRPLIRWTVQDVIDIHHRHGLRPCKLYLQGAKRVGCWPCIFSRKSEVRYMAETDSSRVDLIRELEAAVQKIAAARHQKIIDEGGEMKKTLRPPTFFAGLGYGFTMPPIDKVVDWSKTSRGGKQYNFFREDEREPGCLSWGLCDSGTE
jgi:3'-phosphoadenosine 5'-phosphosulfate sulfotransferase (PAPS reductase)/FAD synthetase